MRGIKAAILLAIVAGLGWAALTIAQMIWAEWPVWRIWQIGGLGGCLYSLCDLADRHREWLGIRGERRTYRRAWGPWRG